jgi:hypothetical protein
MAHPRTPLAKAKVTGATINHPKVHNSRKEPKQTSPLGEPTGFLDEVEQLCWACFQREIPWLTETDRPLIEVACRLRARVWGGTIDARVLGALSSVLSKLGATPADRSKVFVPKDEDGDPEDKFFN